MLEIKNLSVSVQNKTIINGLNLKIGNGKKIAIIGCGNTGSKFIKLF